MINTAGKTKKKEPQCIYGVVIAGKPTPEQVRDAMLNCFREAHRHAMESDLKMGKLSSKKDFKAYEQSYTEFLLRQFFEEAGGDYDRPTKQALKRVVSKLARFSKHFRSKEVVQNHASEFKKLIDQL
ncbi:hypothetical protein D6764_01315 [Candidatus Woesearchaeota archaeon]|nr:MAG: hypothetical protein D6764_01315 [Candidatus Woesearchaeota archaeon]